MESRSTVHGRKATSTPNAEDPRDIEKYRVAVGVWVLIIENVNDLEPVFSFARISRMLYSVVCGCFIVQLSILLGEVPCVLQSCRFSTWFV